MPEQNTHDSIASSSTEDDRLRVARSVLKGLESGYHYAILAYHGETGEPIEVSWNHERDPFIGSRNDDFSDRKESKQHRKLAIKYQQQVKK